MHCLPASAMAEPFGLLLFLYGCVEWWDAFFEFWVRILEVILIAAIAEVRGVWEKNGIRFMLRSTHRSINSNVILRLCPYLTLSPVDRCQAGSQSLSGTWWPRVRSFSSQSLTTCFHACVPSVRLISGTKCFGSSWLGMAGAVGAWLVWNDSELLERR